jgi:hypothetical protein
VAYIGFQKLKEQIARRGTARDPVAVTAGIGRQKYGQEEMTRRSVEARRRKALARAGR